MIVLCQCLCQPGPGRLLIQNLYDYRRGLKLFQPYMGCSGSHYSLPLRCDFSSQPEQGTAFAPASYQSHDIRGSGIQP
jgi:hypothetical protein